MNIPTGTDRLPQASEFVATMWERVQDAYPRVMSLVATAIVQAGGDRDAVVRMVGSRASRAAFLMGCCAEELVSSGFVMKGKEARSYITQVIEALRPLAQPIRSKRIAPDFRRLLTDYGHHPIRMRAKTVNYMLAVNGLEKEQAIVLKDAACELQIKCSVTVDGITGCLLEMMEQAVAATPKAAAITRSSEELGPGISGTLLRLP